MNTNQDTTLTNQYALFNEFIISADWVEIRNMAEDSDELAEGVWQAATKASEQRIQELELVCKCRSELSKSQNDIIRTLIDSSNIKDANIAELQAHVDQLREALTHADEFISNGIEFGYVRMPDESLKGIDSAHDTPEIIRKAICSTPTQSLAQHDNELLDKVIEILSDNGIYHDGAIGKDILKLKVTQ